MLPRPIDITDKRLEKMDDRERAQIGVRFIFNLTDLEKECLNEITLLLNAKRKAREREIDIQKMVNYFQAGRGKPLTEFLCRRLINRYEHEYTREYYFKINNGDDDWKESDKIRNTQVQKAMGS